MVGRFVDGLDRPCAYENRAGEDDVSSKTHFTPSANLSTRCQSIRRQGPGVLQRSIHSKMMFLQKTFATLSDGVASRTAGSASEIAPLTLEHPIDCPGALTRHEAGGLGTSVPEIDPLDRRPPSERAARVDSGITIVSSGCEYVTSGVVRRDRR